MDPHDGSGIPDGSPHQGHDDQAATWSQVFREELTEIRRSRDAPMDAKAREDRVTSGPVTPPDDLAGLAFSGGGIRSATFNLGITQALARFGLLDRFDYLSTVSGGGYIGSWLTRAICEGEGLDSITRDLSWPRVPGRRPEEDEPTPLNWLRRYSNYLTPKVGLFTADTWTTVATYVRNFGLNLVILISLALAVLLIPRVSAGFIPIFESHDFWLLLVSLGMVGLAIASVGINLAQFARGETGSRFWTSQGGIQRTIIIPFVLTSILGSIWLFTLPAEGSQFDAVVLLLPFEWGEWLLAHEALAWTILGAVAYWVVWSITGVVAVLSSEAYSWNAVEKRLPLAPMWRWAPVVGAVGGLFLYAIALLFRRWGSTPGGGPPTEANQWLAFTLGPPLILLLFTAVGALHLGLMGRQFKDRRREWMARLGAWQLIYALVWLGLVGVTVFGPVLLAAGTGWMRSTVTIAWLLSTVGGVVAGQRLTHGSGGRVSAITARFAPYMFIVGFVAALSLMVDWGLARGSERMFDPDHPIETEWVAFWGSADSQTAVDGQTTGAADATPPGSPEQADAGPTFGEQLSARADSHARLLTAQSVEWPALMAVGIGLGLLGLLFAFRVDINEFSMHRYYRNRLVRCYLGASNTRRAGQSFTGFDPNDDLQLALVSKRAAEADGWRYPYPIINSALNLVRKGNLAWQDRKAAAFFFSPLYCGFEVPDWEDRRASGAGGPASPGQARRRLGGFRPTHDYGSPGAPLKSLLRVILGLRPAIDKKIDEKKDEVPDGGIGLGTAFAISGAAASPNMGFRTTPALSFLMTVFNVRLGWWLGNPSRDGWKRPGPTLALKCLFSELFGLTTIDSKFVYLSDGGHFENLGLYELVRRRCRYVVLCDVGQDQDIWFADLGNAIRKCYTDFGARVEIGVNPIRREVHPYTQEESEFNGSHFTLGTIHYPDQDGAARGTWEAPVHQVFRHG